MNKKIKDKIFLGYNWILTLVTMCALIIIIAYILVKGLPYVNWEFLSQEPSNMGKDGGIFSVIIGTLFVTGLALIIAIPIGLMAAVYFSEYAKDGKVLRTIRFFTEVLAGIPSIIFGLFGFAFFVIYCGLGWSVISGALTLSLMILPTIIRATEESLITVPTSVRDGSLALGASKWYTIRKIVLPSCSSGIKTGVVLGTGRAIGETAAVMLTVGGSLNIPTSVFDSTRTMSVHLYTLASEGLSEEKTYATAALLIVIILIINGLANYFSRKGSLV